MNCTHCEAIERLKDLRQWSSRLVLCGSFVVTDELNQYCPEQECDAREAGKLEFTSVYSFSCSEVPRELAAVSPGQEYSKIIHCHGALLNGSLPQCKPVIQEVHKPEATSTVSKSRENLHHLTGSPHSFGKDPSPPFIYRYLSNPFYTPAQMKWLHACLQPSFANMAGLAMRLEPDPFSQWRRGSNKTEKQLPKSVIIRARVK